MLCSGCSALHGVNPNQKRKSKNCFAEFEQVINDRSSFELFSQEKGNISITKTKNS